MFLMGRFNTSPNIKYEKFGFTKLEESWIQWIELNYLL
jgi:hypothetical protein